MNTSEEFLEHFGIKGMKWGVRNEARSSGISRKTDRDARKDAEEFATARAFHGKGAGTRRKLIKQTVEGKSKRDPNYAKAFEQHLSRQDTAKHVSKAVSQRKGIDRRTRTKQQAGYVARRLTGEMGTQAAFAAAVIGGGAFLASPKGRRIMSNVVSKFSDASYNRKQKNGADYLADYFKRNS